VKRDDVRCREVVEVLTDYLDGALPSDEREALEQHLLACTGCAAHLGQLRTTVRLTGKLSESDVPPMLMDRLLATYAERHR
jgi:anti-sigma factor (TIGR02949 family)